ncbi:MAG: transglutaminase-like cysteine peptidase [Roseitalea sp.]|jgi:predicted transglutaminase-like cysteine proteinase|uniref:Transglutaminase n=1 Tax=Oceaniradius stylonematis TaxID=2184161 RepID=A0A3A8AS69_9HYPH|nr:transglutaminase-like cysteine peptidase [Oceaniradius stylonematis]MBO6553563.1 transglutaminase-like cysteine peptidase [Roseitalea sp.]MBO6952606.1 transglutaminase-like cysteine peptidase [Rhizobiaceae bacterium]RNC91476.1 MAG: transglutaminase [Oricola sp.]MBO6592907.1 transglutaminase-like cysteine peptidase [Roseitalea sp.]MBO6600350.1 transglutaminase-like cysteine peptidase [Roseitalea sp.]
MRFGWIAAVSAGLAALAGPADAGAMKTGGLTSQPIGHYEFCRLYTEECRQKRGSYKPITITREIWAQILNVNSAVNMVIEPRSDMDIYGREEVWTFPDAAGDCEDYVLLKRQMLIGQGLPPSGLLITVVRKPDGEGHAVLTVRTDRGDFVLDNLRSEVRLWSDTEYTYLKRQSERHAGHWVSIEMPDRMVVGSVEPAAPTVSAR